MFAFIKTIWGSDTNLQKKGSLTRGTGFPLSHEEREDRIDKCVQMDWNHRLHFFFGNEQTKTNAVQLLPQLSRATPTCPYDAGMLPLGHPCRRSG